MSNQVDESKNDIDNRNTEKKSEKELEPTEKQDNQHHSDDGNSMPNDSKNNENIENSKNDQTNQDNEKEQQTTKSNIGKNRHITTNEEKEILSKALPEYLKLPNRTTDRQNKERNVAKKLKALSPECDEYWNHKKVRDWFNNNNPDKRNKNLDSDIQHLPKKAVMLPGSAPLRIYPESSSSGSFIQENQRIPDFNNNRIFNQYIPNQNRSQFVKIYNANSPTSSAILSLNSNSKVFPNTQEIQPTSYSEIRIPCVNNMISSAQKVANAADNEKSNNIESLSRPQIQSQQIQPQPQQPQINQEPQPQQRIQPQQIQMPQIQQPIQLPTSSQIQPIQPPKIQHIIQSPQIHQPPQIQSQQIQSIQPPQIHQLPQIHQPIQPQQNQQPILSSNIQPQIQYQTILPPQIQPPVQLQNQQIQPQMHNHSSQPQLQRPPYQTQYQQPTHVPPPAPLLSQLHKRIDTNQKQISNPEEEEKNLPKSPAGERISAELPKNMNIGKNSPKKKSSFKKAFEKDKQRYEDLQRKLATENPPEDIIISQTPYEKYQQQKQNEPTDLSQEQVELMHPNFTEFKKNPDSTLFLSSSFKSKSKNKSLVDDSNEPDPLPLVPEEELRNYLDKLKTITLSRISQLLKIIEERKNINQQILKMKFRKRNNKDDNVDYSSSSETEMSHKDEVTGINEKEKDSSYSLEKPTTFNQNDQLIFEERTEKRMNELIDFYHNKFGNQKIVLTISIGSTKKSNPPIQLTEKSIIESGEFSPENKHRRKESIEEIINEKKCVVNFGRNKNFELKIHVPKDVEKNNDEKIIKFYRGDFEKKEVVPLSVFDSLMNVEASLFFDDSDEMFLISYDPQEKKSLFVFNDSFIQAPFKKTNRKKAVCKFPSSLKLNNIILVTDGDKLVYFNTDSMSVENVYKVSIQSKQKRSLIASHYKSESCKVIYKPYNEFRSSVNLSNIKIETVDDVSKEKVAICATSYGDVLVGIKSHIFFFNKEKDENSYYSLIQLENMKNVSSICTFEIRTSPDENGETFSIPLIVVGDINYPTIYVFNGNDHSLVARLVGHTSGISCLYNNGFYLFSGSVDGKIIMWELKLILDDQNEEEKNENNNQSKKFSVFAYSSLTLFIHSEPIIVLRLGKVGNIHFLISCDSNLVRATDINRHNSSFSISVPEEFEINSLNFDDKLGEVDFILASHQTDKFTDRMEIFAIE